VSFTILFAIEICYKEQCGEKKKGLGEDFLLIYIRSILTSDKYHYSHTLEQMEKTKKQKTLAEHTRAKKRREKRPMETLTTEQLVNTMVSSASCTKMVWQWEIEAKGWIGALVIRE
jgi:hypothetical protein